MKRLLAAALAACALLAAPAVAQVAISGLPNAVAPSSSDTLPVVQSGQTRKITADQFVWTTGAQSVAGVKTFTATTMQVPALVQFGGATSSSPALKVSGAGLAARLADDSADSPITASVATSTSYSATSPKTVATLPSASTAGAGARSFVTDATGCTFGSTVTGGGTTACPVYSDATAWRAG